MTLLFKYRPPIDFSKTVHCNTARIFSNSALYYAKPSTFNDPFDGRILFDFIADKNDAYDRQFRVMRRRARERSEVELHVMVPTVTQAWNQAKKNVDYTMDLLDNKRFDYERYYRDAMDNFGALALSAEKHNLLLWAHYAADHRGLCLGFDWEATGLPPASEMQYSTSYPKIDFWSHSEAELAKIALFQKSSEWAYEQEFRSINPATFEWYPKFDRNAASREAMKKAKTDWPGRDGRILRRDVMRAHTYTYKRPKKDGAGTLNFAKDSLREVIFGERMTRESIIQHAHFIRGWGFNPVFWRAVRNPRRFSIDFERL
ncbi:DUF2971 domain-containing protein [Paraburkholderia strydomiana]|uniref:DUF2971 domain-containing protein n=1 Tax=Paraburkholderia strydomiana TaxID=1245417 RepID=UPI0038BD6F1E